MEQKDVFFALRPPTIEQSNLALRGKNQSCCDTNQLTTWIFLIFRLLDAMEKCHSPPFRIQIPIFSSSSAQSAE
jgi:hypothetical protein